MKQKETKNYWHLVAVVVVSGLIVLISSYLWKNKNQSLHYTVYSAYINKVSQWMRDKNLASNQEPKKVVTMTKSMDSEITFEFYNTLPNVRVADNTVSEAKNNVGIVSAKSLEEELEKQMRRVGSKHDL